MRRRIGARGVPAPTWRSDKSHGIVEGRRHASQLLMSTVASDVRCRVAIRPPARPPTVVSLSLSPYPARHARYGLPGQTPPSVADKLDDCTSVSTLSKLCQTKLPAVINWAHSMGL